MNGTANRKHLFVNIGKKTKEMDQWVTIIDDDQMHGTAGNTFETISQVKKGRTSKHPINRWVFRWWTKILLTIRV